MRWRRPCSWAISVATGALVLAGCASGPAPVQTFPARRLLTDRAGHPGFVVAAPHAALSPRTAEIAAELGRRTGFGVVVAPGAPGVEDYARSVREAARGPLRLLVEIDGGLEGTDPIEIATVGVGRDEAFQLRTLFELIRDAHLGARDAAEKLEVRVGPIDRVRHAAPDDATLRPDRALHVALPRVARGDWRELYTEILADFLVEAAALPVAR